jgi:type II secretory pathway component PulF
MPQFRYRAVTHAGEIVVGEVDAPSREEVVRRIEYLGHLTIDAEIAATGILTRSRRRGGKSPRSRDVSIFLRQLALLIGAGLTLEAALQTLGNDAAGGNEQDVVRIVAAESQPRIALFAFGIDLDLAEMGTEALRLLHMRGSEGEG